MNKELPTDTITMDNVEKIYDFIFAPYVKQLKLSFLEIGVGRVVARLDNLKDYQFVMVYFFIKMAGIFSTVLTAQSVQKFGSSASSFSV